MNIGKCKNRPKYICDKCGQIIPYIYQKGFDVNKYYKQEKYNYAIKKEFDLCNKCEKRLQEWLETKENECQENLLNSFPIWEEEKR